MRQKDSHPSGFDSPTPAPLLDEPCSGLDPVSARIIRDYLFGIKSIRSHYLLNQHDMEEDDELCDFIGFINNGKLMVLSDKNKLKTNMAALLLKFLTKMVINCSKK